MRRVFLPIALSIASSLFAQEQPRTSPSSAASADSTPSILLQAVELTSPGGEKTAYELGTLTVPENRADPASRKIGVGFARFRATTPSEAPPIFLLPGGPGQSYVAMVTPGQQISGGLMRQIQLYQRVSDVILVDQRGFSPRGQVLTFTGTQPAFPLDEPASLAKSTAADLEMARAAVADAAAKGIDLAGYTVLEMADDVNDLRQELGYDKITLVGTSFGSQWSFAIMRRHPEIVTRALLSGVEPLDHGFDSPSGVIAAIARIAEAAEQDSLIQPYLAGLPDQSLMAAARALVARLDSAPFRKTDGEVAAVVGAEDFRKYFPKSQRGFASTILSLYYGQHEGWVQQVLEARQGGRRRFPLIGPLVDGSLGVTPERAQRLKIDPATELLGHWNFDSYMASADIWPSPDVGDSIRIPVKTDIPVVFAQGDWDTSTPVENTLEIAPFFPKGHVIIAHHGGHGVIDPIARHHPAVMEQLLHFLATGETAGLPKEVDLPVPRFPAPKFPPPTTAGAGPSAATGQKPNGE